MRLLLTVGALLLLGSGGVGVWLYLTSTGAARTDLITHAAKRERLQLTIVERGQLEAATNEDVVCKVKAGSKGSTIATTIKWVLDDGTHVKKNDLLITLDDSGLQEQLKTQEITLRQADAAKTKAEEDYKITESQNDSDLSKAKTDKELAEIELDKYIKGDYEQAKKDIEGRVLIARSDREMWRDRVEWSDRMVKGKYITEAQLLADKARLKSAEVAVEKVDEEMRVLKDFTRRREVTDKTSKLSQAVDAIDRTVKQNKAKIVQAEAERTSKQKIHEQELSRFEEVKEQIKHCELRAPKDGLVVYYVPDQSRWGGGSRQSIIAQGEPVNEGQKLMRIPDLSHMFVKTKVHEALVSRVKPEQPAKVRLDAFPERSFAAKVKTVATVADQGDWLSSDVKAYQTMVSIEEDVESLGLKPGMSAAVTIFTEQRSEDALTIPIQAIMGTAGIGKKQKCYVMTPQGPKEREITIGISNEKMVEVTEGLEEGEQVVLNPRSLQNDKDRKVFGGGDRLIKGDEIPPAGGMMPGKGGPPGGDGMKGGYPGKSGPPGGEGGKPGGMPGKGGPPGGFTKGAPAGDGGKAAGAGQ